MTNWINAKSRDSGYTSYGSQPSVTVFLSAKITISGILGFLDFFLNTVKQSMFWNFDVKPPLFAILVYYIYMLQIRVPNRFGQDFIIRSSSIHRLLFTPTVTINPSLTTAKTRKMFLWYAVCLGS